MKRGKWIFWGLAFLIVALFYFGIFQEIKIEEKEVGPFKIVYETYTGDYSDAKKIPTDIQNSLFNEGIEANRKFGIYYDNPSEVSKEKLRSEVGVIVDGEDYAEIEELRGQYNVKTMPKTKSVVTDFPFRNKFSIIIGFFKVYPKLNKYIEEQGYEKSPAMEIYDDSAHKIIYILEIK